MRIPRNKQVPEAQEDARAQVVIGLNFVPDVVEKEIWYEMSKPSVINNGEIKQTHSMPGC